ncbi:hypothetical protein L1987_58861 [Smallanthus sonchifolius]|uniref:Uncharacterized protein n=1 Tax=Smallanthus sonchifolius TaxID=185202 RepID=A0ACB9D3P8_9ASTR|nr:hypothetical protein L1987_58861 [Smallanthus sonchifolius]
MEAAWRPSSTAGDDTGGHNSNFTNPAWDIWDIGTRYDPRVTEARVVHALLFNNTTFHHRMPDPHMMCLKLGKRHYCERHVTAAESSTATKRGKPQYPYYVTDTSTTRVVPICLVEGCHVALGNAKEYYKKHKVCEVHSKAPNVVVLGLHQRFCQQCSRFHVVTEFDEAKRSCRRRLKGHNQRRRKGTRSMTERRLGPPSQSQPGCARSLLSSPETEALNFSGDLSSRCSAALYELIAANRATSVSRHFLNQNTFHQAEANTQIWDRFGHMTTTPDLKQAPTLEFGRLSMKERVKDPEEWTDYSWSSFGGANVV